MRVKVDEDLPSASVQLLKQHGHDAVGVVEQGMGGASDSVLWRTVQEEQRFLVTADKGFGDLRFYPPGAHAGVLVLRPDQDGIRPVLALLERVLASYELMDLAGTIAVATPRAIRIRRKTTGAKDIPGQSS
jgi:predicted nuclease of predicted toxin-antitoxin system